MVISDHFLHPNFDARLFCRFGARSLHLGESALACPVVKTILPLTPLSNTASKHSCSLCVKYNPTMTNFMFCFSPVLVSCFYVVAARFVTTARFVTKVTKRVRFAEKSTRCTFCHAFASNTIICLSLLWLCVCVRTRAFVCVFPRTRVCVDVHLSVAARARPRMLCIVLCLLSPPQSALDKFCIALSRLRGYCCP